MSASNWAECPRCTAADLKALAERHEAVEEMYGKVPIDEFDEARRQHAKRVADFKASEATFREDYEIYGADDGVVKVSYSGWCTRCDLRLEFTHEHPIPGLENLS